MTEEIKQIEKEWLKEFQPPTIMYLEDRDKSLCCPLCGVKAKEISDWWIKKIEQTYKQGREDGLKEINEKLDRLDDRFDRVDNKIDNLEHDLTCENC